MRRILMSLIVALAWSGYGSDRAWAAVSATRREMGIYRIDGLSGSVAAVAGARATSAVIDARRLEASRLRLGAIHGRLVEPARGGAPQDDIASGLAQAGLRRLAVGPHLVAHAVVGDEMRMGRARQNHPFDAAESHFVADAEHGYTEHETDRVGA